MITIKATQKTKWYQLRRRLSSFFVYLARKIEPKNPDVYAFYAELILQQQIYGTAILSPLDCLKEVSGDK